MPKIDAPTVAEHHARQRAALLRAARETLVTDGPTAVTPAAVGAAAGLARSSVYQYFPSTGALLAAVVEDAFPAANETLRRATVQAGGPWARVDAYVRAALELSTTDVHRAVRATSRAPMPEACLARLAELHAEQAAPLVEALSDLGVPDARTTAALVGGLLAAATRAIEAGGEPDVVVAQTLALVHGGVAATGNG